MFTYVVEHANYHGGRLPTPVYSPVSVMISGSKKIHKKLLMVAHYIFIQTCATNFLHVLTTLAKGVGSKQQQQQMNL
jgi:hypothetical protein